MPKMENLVQLHPITCGSCKRVFAVVQERNEHWYILDDETMTPEGNIMFCPWCGKGIT